MKLSTLFEENFGGACEDGHGPIVPVRGGEQVQCRTCGYQVRDQQLLEIFWDEDTPPGDKLEASNAYKKLKGEPPPPVRSKTRERRKDKLEKHTQSAMLHQAFNQGRAAQSRLY